MNVAKSAALALLLGVCVVGLDVVNDFKEQQTAIARLRTRRPEEREEEVFGVTLTRAPSGRIRWLDFLTGFFLGRARADADMHPTRDNPKFQTELHLFDKPDQVVEACNAKGVPWSHMPVTGSRRFRSDDPVGCAVFHLDPEPDTGLHKCEVYAVAPRDTDDAYTTTLGHEILHCKAGVYHD